ncbi:Protein FAR1-RELATED SEQUENCE 5 [Linum perenne]
MRKTAGGTKQLGFLHTDLKNYIWEKRTRDMQGGDVTVIANHFCKKQNENDGFFFDKELDSDENIASIFWSDATMRKDFKYFGDLISFDTTYRTNNTSRPLAIFVGKNNHHQLIVFELHYYTMKQHLHSSGCLTLSVDALTMRNQAAFLQINVQRLKQL